MSNSKQIAAQFRSMVLECVLGHYIQVFTVLLVTLSSLASGTHAERLQAAKHAEGQWKQCELEYVTAKVKALIS